MSRQCDRVLERGGAKSPGDRPPPLPTLLPSEPGVGLASAWSRQPRTADGAEEGARRGDQDRGSLTAGPHPALPPAQGRCVGGSEPGLWSKRPPGPLAAPSGAGVPAQAPLGADLRPPSGPLRVEKGPGSVRGGLCPPQDGLGVPGAAPPERAGEQHSLRRGCMGSSVISPEQANCVPAPSALVGLPVLSPLDRNTDWGAAVPLQRPSSSPFICRNIHIPQRFSGLSRHPGRELGRGGGGVRLADRPRLRLRWGLENTPITNLP